MMPGDQLGKRQREKESGDFGKDVPKSTLRGAISSKDVGELPGPQLGNGPKWVIPRRSDEKQPKEEKPSAELELLLLEKRSRQLEEVKYTLDELDEMHTHPEVEFVGEATSTKKYIELLEEENRMLREGAWKRCSAMLQQALSSDAKETDVSLVDEHGGEMLRAHRGMLCAASREFRSMFNSGMIEEKEGIVRMPPGISVASARAFLEWVYLGREGDECLKADGRELWVLSEMYEVHGIREWLTSTGISATNLHGAIEFSQVPEGDRSCITEACVNIAKIGLCDVTPWMGMTPSIARLLAEKRKEYGSREGYEGGWRADVDVFSFLTRWFDAQMRSEAALKDAKGMLSLVSLPALPSQVLRELVRTSPLCNRRQVDTLIEQKQDVESAFCRTYTVDTVYSNLGSALGESLSSCLRHVSVSDRMIDEPFLGHRLIAVADTDGHRVVIFREGVSSAVGVVESGEHFELTFPTGVAWLEEGCLAITDSGTHTTVVVDRLGNYLTQVGYEGRETGNFRCPRGICRHTSGFMVADSLNERLQYFMQTVTEEGDPTWRSVGCLGKAIVGREGPPTFYDGVAVGAGEWDKRIAVADFGRSCVHIFDRNDDGTNVNVTTIGGLGEGQGKLHSPCGIAVGPKGEIIVSDNKKREIQIFDHDGRFIQSIGEQGDSMVPLQSPWGLSVDQDGTIWVADQGCSPLWASRVKKLR